MKRIALALLASALFTLGLFWVMHRMVSGPAELQRPDQDRAVVDFIRLKQDSQTELKERRKPEPPKPQKPKLPQESVSQQDVPMQQIPFKVPQVTPDLSLSQQSLLGDAVVGLGFGDSDVIPLVRMNAVYPQRALRQKIEGFVTARLQITPEGTVESVNIIEAQPRGVFEREAIRALYKYKFKPKMENGRPVAQTATQTIEFKLGDS
ncbi:TonB family protein [Venatoribacter cucullus]|uniref:Protein TonB n=1 Tax=Venatoribacter cucullus TaxID=2661630 RepID=A0A9X7YP10_9GAMM|nr:energy transducer TonB [Venatoribacter cucullus]QQD21503.1 TonB family protein [Oceanospirillaceae bacterium ASx5O]QQD24181.1 TonB family protein [Venatoribacter cucullus]